MELLLLSLLLGARVSGLWAAELVTANTGGGSGLDLSETDLTTKYCWVYTISCPNPAESIIEANAYSGTVDQCLGKCNRDTRCLSTSYNDENRMCLLRNTRCTDGSMSGGVSHVREFYRLKKDETCPSPMKPFKKSPPIYGNGFCMIWGKTCTGKKTYYQNPASMATYQACIDKCNKVTTCGMANYDFENKKCEMLLDQCDDEELTDASNIQNFMRLPIGVEECPDNRVPPAPTPPPTQAPTEEPATEEPYITEPPVVAPSCPKPYVKKIKTKGSDSSMIARCEGGCKMTVCHCKPYKKCDGAEMTADGGCKVTKRTGKRQAKKKDNIKAFIKCEGVEDVQYLRLDHHGDPLTCPLGYRLRDCTFYAPARGGNRRANRGNFKLKKRCAPGPGCSRSSGCLTTAACVKYGR